MLTSEAPLADIYKDYTKMEDGHMDMVRSCIKDRAEKEAKRLRELRDLPVYLYPGDYAHEHDEIDQYRESRKANIACRDAIDAAISEHYHENSLDVKASVAQVVDVFGYERMLHVCANTVRQKEWDGRISHDNIQWARTLPIYEDKSSFGDDRRVDYIVDRSHPGLFDMFVKAARREYLLTQPLTPEEIKQEAANILSQFQAAKEPNSPDGTLYVARVTPLFLDRTHGKGLQMLEKYLPFPSLALTSFRNRSAIYAVISAEEDRSKKLKPVRASVLEKLQKNKAETTQKKAQEKPRKQER